MRAYCPRGSGRGNVSKHNGCTGGGPATRASRPEHNKRGIFSTPKFSRRHEKGAQKGVVLLCAPSVQGMAGVAISRHHKKGVRGGRSRCARPSSNASHAWNFLGTIKGVRKEWSRYAPLSPRV
eukprot:7554884-Pyramimonas_sp.AAC.1